MLIVGCGDIGRRVAGHYHAEGRAVTAVTRSDARARALQQQGLDVLQRDLDSNGPPVACSDDKQIFYFAPPPREGRLDTRMRNFLQNVADCDQPQRIVYISTSGVYGDCQGDWVDESSPVRPQVDRALRRWDAECCLRDWRQQTGGELVILRVAGIYGAGKLPLARLRQQTPMVSESDAPWTNRIHAEDLAAVCVAAMARGRDGEIYNVSDGRPGNMCDYFNSVADFAGLPRPPVISLAEAQGSLSAGLLSYLAESRRLRNNKMLHELGVQLRYPDLDSGLAACGLGPAVGNGS